MAVRCKVVRGLPKEVEEEINKFLSTCPVRLLHVAQSETHDHVTVTLVFDEADGSLLGRSSDETRPMECLP